VTEIEIGLVRRKLAVMAQDLVDLTSLSGLTLEEYRRDRLRLKGIERLLQEVVEAAVDVNLHLLRAAGAATPPDYHESFLAMGRQGIVPAALGEALAPAAGLRNRLVHEYDDIDDAIVLRAVAAAPVQFGAYIQQIERYLSGQPIS
jgi:uncharacterized protein YutE (UPF0331/DUF86 family)